MNLCFYGVALFAFLLSACSTVKNIGVDQNISGSLKKPDEKTQIIEIIHKEEKNNGIPKGLLHSIASVESSNTPYAVNCSKRGYSFKSKTDAVQFVKSMIQQGKKNLSVGCLQLHYQSHKSKFDSIDSMMDPKKNIAYAAFLLQSLYKKYGSWENAVKFYHSGQIKKASRYYNLVMLNLNRLN